ncbi:MAG: bifunctional phosphoribosylaminoimidazolecarboxamide formyltransferase/IMP cyclohydrolase [Coxiellaceae bacterium]|nr:MAG: bifunctional phosphoribosylaminoimidazolecarboxamide formyltransferase/IMP cyclohydrolase [Coxiellaceae bacterium]
MPEISQIKRALISVSDKTGIVELARELHKFNVEILSTGGTAKLLQDHQLPVVEIADYTGFPELMDGRLKTLHPKIHGGLLGRRGKDDAAMANHQIPPIDLLVVNLYPFAATIAKPGCSLAEAIENIDIGGPTMLRAAAKNFPTVTVAVDASDYPHIIAEMQANQGGTTLATRFNLARKVFAHTAHYDGLIANYLHAASLDNQPLVPFPDVYTLQLVKQQSLRYGENPHQAAAFYAEMNGHTYGLAHAKQWQGKELSYNNIADADAAYEAVMSFTEGPACVIVKHANPCGVALSATQIGAYQAAYKTDPTSAFGGIIAFNRPLTAETAATLLSQQFVEVIIAPAIAPEAMTILQQKPNIRALTIEPGNEATQNRVLEHVLGGMLIQDRDTAVLTPQQLKTVTTRQPSEEELQDLLFAWKVAKYVKSNAIVLAKNQATIGIGAGQMSRIDSVEIAISKARKAGLDTKGAVLASDAFFPFADGLQAAAEAGITAIIQPGGSLRDNEVIQAADSHQLAMVLTGIRHFRH